MLDEKKERRALSPGAQPIDEIRIITEPRYKQSGMSGDEWRISASTQFFRKGKLIFTDHSSNIEYAVRLLDKNFIHVSEGNGAYYGEEGDLCDQEGCAEKASVKYRIKKEYCRSGHGEEPQFGIVVRLFCNKHKTRGDCGLEDADDNYEIIDGGI